MFFITVLVTHIIILGLGFYINPNLRVEFAIFPFRDLTVSLFFYGMAHAILLVAMLYFKQWWRINRVKLLTIIGILALIGMFYFIHAGLLYLSANLRPAYLLTFNFQIIGSLFVLFFITQGLADIPFRLATSYLNQRVNLTKASLTVSVAQVLLILSHLVLFEGNARFVVLFYAVITPLLGLLSSYLYFAFKNMVLVVFSRTLFFTMMGYALANYEQDYIPYVIVVILLGASINALNKNVHFIKLFEPL